MNTFECLVFLLCAVLFAIASAVTNYRIDILSDRVTTIIHQHEITAKEVNMLRGMMK